MDWDKDIRWKQRFNNFQKAYKTLGKYITHPIDTEIERAGIIQLFEVAFELSWKLMKDFLESRGYLLKSPREVIKQAFQSGLILDGHGWIDALADRNLTVQTYDEKLSIRMAKDITEHYFPLIEQLYEEILKEL